MNEKPTLEKCRDLNLWCKWDGDKGQYVACDASDPHAREDMKRLDMVLQGKEPLILCSGKGAR